jgi:hypothetical protein
MSSFRTPGRKIAMAAFDAANPASPGAALETLQEIVRLLGGVESTNPDQIRSALESLLIAAGVETDDADADPDRAIDPEVRASARSAAQREHLEHLEERARSARAEAATPLPRRTTTATIELTPAQIRICREMGCDPAAFIRLKRAGTDRAARETARSRGSSSPRPRSRSRPSTA